MEQETSKLSLCYNYCEYVNGWVAEERAEAIADLVNFLTTASKAECEMIFTNVHRALPNYDWRGYDSDADTDSE